MVAAVLQRKTVLLVEDDAWIRTFLRDALSDEGYAVLEAADGLTAVRLAKERTPNIVLLDVAMPEFTGIDVLHALRQARETRSLPVLILTAYRGVLSEQDANSAVAVLSKPIDIEALLAAVRGSVAASSVKA